MSLVLCDDHDMFLEALTGALTSRGHVIDAATPDLRYAFPPAEKFHADPEAHRPPGRTDADLRRGYPEMPATGPAFRPEPARA